MKEKFKAAYTSNADELMAVKDLIFNLEANPSLILFFASSNYDSLRLSKAFSIFFPSSTVIGCSTSGEIVSGKMLDNSLVAMGFTSSTLEDFDVAVIEDIQGNPSSVKNAIREFELHFKEKLNYEKHVGIVLTDGLGGTEELVMDKIGDATEITFTGGSAGDDLKFKQTTLYYNCNIYHSGSLLLVLKPKVKFSVLKTQRFKATGKILKVTKGIEEERNVLESDNKPATVASAEALGILEKEKGGAISGIINFNCVLRTLDLKRQNRTSDYGKLFEKYPTIGFSTYGKSYTGHINQTATMLIFH